MLKLVVEFEKKSLLPLDKDNDETKVSIDQKLTKLQMECNLFEAAMNARRQDKSLFERFVEDVNL